MKTSEIFSLAFIISFQLQISASFTDNTEKLQQVLDNFYAEHPELVGIMVHIEAPEQHISWSGATGLSDKSDAISIESNQPMLIASNTKPYVSAAILRLVEQGKISLDNPIDTLISSKSRNVLKQDGYELQQIQVQHLLSHTSGIFDFVESVSFADKEEHQPGYFWTRDEQIQLAIDEGDPLGKSGDLYKYSDTNYLLLTEIIENLTGKVYYTAIRELLKYEQLNLGSTWFFTLEDSLVNTKPLITQYYKNYTTKYESPTFDLYGGGGIAATIRELGLFNQYLFEGKIFDHHETIDLLYTYVETRDQEQYNYRLGIRTYTILGEECFGHDGFWGTATRYMPERNITFAVSISNISHRAETVEKLVLQFLATLFPSN